MLFIKEISHNKKYAVGLVDADGELFLKSDSNTVRIPFETEYGILLKNLTFQSCCVEIEIDGTSILGENKVIINPKEKVIIDRFCVDNNLLEGKKLKFVSSDSELVQDPTSEDNGNVIVKFYPIPKPFSSITRGTTRSSFGYGGRVKCSIRNESISSESNIFRDKELDIGATVEGDISSQKFVKEASVKINKDDFYTISFSIKGEKKVDSKNNSDKTICKAGFCLDRSGSMSNKKNEVIKGFNDQLEELKKSPQNVEVFVTLGTFSTYADEINIINKPVRIVEKLNEYNYKPSGSTAMLDGVAKMVESLLLSSEEKERTTYLVIVISDGAENASTFYDWEEISHIVKKLQSKGNWTFVYLGANQDLSEVSEKMNLNKNNVRLFEDSPCGYSEAIKATSDCTEEYLNKISKGMKIDNFYN